MGVNVSTPDDNSVETTEDFTVPPQAPQTTIDSVWGAQARSASKPRDLQWDRIYAHDQLVALLEEPAGYAAPADGHDPASDTSAREGANRWLGEHGILAPLRIRAPDGGELSFFGMIATFGTPAEVTTSELTIEMLFPADPATAEALDNLPRR
jgi:hypothetical protein